MQDNDLTNTGHQRSIVVFNDFLGRRKHSAPPPKPKRGITVEWVQRAVDHIRKRYIEEGDPTWEIDPKAVQYVNMIPFRTDTSVEVVTFAGRLELPEIENLLDEAGVFYQELYGWTMDELARRCGWDQSIYRVYHNDPEHWLAYGPKGHYVGDL